jgi:hypothetical protein
VPAQVVVPEFSFEKFDQTSGESDEAPDVQVGGTDLRYQTATTAWSSSQDKMMVW